MTTKYIGIEAISIVNKNRVTIACNIMTEGFVYDEPIYTNIFCNYAQLCELLNLDNSELAKEIIQDIETQSIISDNVVIQIDLPDYLPGQIEWNFKTMIHLEIAKEADIPLQCYSFVETK